MREPPEAPPQPTPQATTERRLTSPQLHLPISRARRLRARCDGALIPHTLALARRLYAWIPQTSSLRRATRLGSEQAPRSPASADVAEHVSKAVRKLTWEPRFGKNIGQVLPMLAKVWPNASNTRGPSRPMLVKHMWCQGWPNLGRRWPDAAGFCPAMKFGQN